MPLSDLSRAELELYRADVFEPEDFDAFWAGTLAETQSHDLAVELRPVDNKLAVIETFDLSYRGFAGAPVRAWLHLPVGVTTPLPAVIQYLGYSGGRGLPFARTQWAQAGYAQLVMDTRGQGWATGGPSGSLDPVVEAGAEHVPGFMTAGILDPHTYYYRRVFVDAVRLLQVAAADDRIDPARIAITGISQGGGITLAVAGLAPTLGIPLAAVAPDVPFLCHYRRGVDISPKDPYAEIARYVAGWRDRAPAAFRTLGYMDGVNFGRRATAPALFSVALMDAICPPSTVYAAYRAYGTGSAAEPSKAMSIYEFNDHEGGEDYQVDAQLDWFAERFAASTG